VVMKQEPLALAAMRGLSVTVGPVCIFRWSGTTFLIRDATAFGKQCRRPSSIGNNEHHSLERKRAILLALDSFH
jgi:hypothetical protein